MGHREQLLAGAKRCLYERGYAHTTARDIVTASGTNLASIGYHFGSKEALLNAAMIEAGRTGFTALLLGADPATVPAADDEPTSPATSAKTAAAGESAGPAASVGSAADQGPTTPSAAGAAGSGSAVGALVMALISGLSVQWLLDPERAPSAQDITDALRTLLALMESAGSPGGSA